MIKKMLMTGASLLFFAGAAQAVVLFEDNFDGNLPGDDAIPSGWNVPLGTVDIQPIYVGQGNQIDLDGGAGGAISTNQTFDLIAGRTYTLSFSYGKAVTNVNVLPEAAIYNVGSYGTGILQPTSNAAMFNTAFSFLAVANELGVTINFLSFFTADDQGLIIDNVKFEELTPVPLPPAAFLLATGLMGMGALARKKKI